jgi:nitrite reductase/ring-hydroxylating ferredoxin subunit
VLFVRQKICNLENIEKLSCKEFVVKKPTFGKNAFLIYFNNHCYAYENSCPHTGVSLNWQEGQFFSVDGLFIQCSLHGALFDPEKGTCVRGSCRGDALKQLNVAIENGVVYLSD